MPAISARNPQPESQRLQLPAAAAFLGAFLFCWSLPMLAALATPGAGGATGVWAAVLAFGFAAIAAGMGWALALVRFLPRGGQPWALSLVAGASLLLLPAGKLPSLELAADPALPLLFALVRSAGLHSVALVSACLLLEGWARGAGSARLVRRALAWGAPAGFFAGPILFEPFAGVRGQAALWSALYAAFVALSAAAFWLPRMRRAALPEPVQAPAQPGRREVLFSLGWAACSAWFFVAVANWLCLLVFPCALVWSIPATVYAITVTLAASNHKVVDLRYIRWLAPVAFAGPVLHLLTTVEAGAYAHLAAYSAVVFLAGVFCHTRLVRFVQACGAAPSLWLAAAGGAVIGAGLAGVAAPKLTSWQAELPLAAIFCAILTLQSGSARAWVQRSTLVPLLALAALILAGYLHIPVQGIVLLARTSRGPVAVMQDEDTRLLRYGADVRATQLRSAQGSRIPAAYYGTQSGLGQFLQARVGASRIAIFGLNAGTLAVYGRPGDYIKFFEADPSIPYIASTHFDYLKSTQANLDIATGDPRLLFAKEPPQSYHVLIIDSFTGGAIPSHLLSREAFELYFSRLRPEGVIAVNTGSRVIDLTPLLAGIAASTGRTAMVTEGRPGATAGALASHWMLLTAEPALIRDMPRHLVRTLPQPAPVWTDESRSVLGLLR